MKLVAYFSASGITEELAKRIADIKGADLFEIQPKIHYTDADLNWRDENSRSTVEMRDKTSRPEIANKVDDMDKYDTIYVGFPIWWYVAPTIINTFLESYNLSGKTIIPFATSGGSDYGKTTQAIAGSCKGANLVEGEVIKTSISDEDLKTWLKNH